MTTNLFLAYFLEIIIVKSNTFGFTSWQWAFFILIVLEGMSDQIFIMILILLWLN
jgi:hypothetical protein